MPLETLLRTKLFAPPAHRNRGARPRLLDRLVDALCPGTHLTLVCAPAGFGKTSLVAEWIALLKPPSNLPTPAPQAQAGSEKETAGTVEYAWLTLDETENDPIRFWRYVDAALQNIDPQLGGSLRPALDALQPPPFRTLLGERVNHILTQAGCKAPEFSN